MEFLSRLVSGNWKKNLEMSNIYHQANFVFWQSEFCKNCANKFWKRKGPGEVLYNCVDILFQNLKL